MRVNIELQNDIKEPYAVIYTDRITGEIFRLAELIGETAQRDSVMLLQQEEKYIVVKPEEIYMVRFEEDQVVLYGKEEKYFSRNRLYQVEEELEKNFIRISKTTIINIGFVESIEPSFSGTMVLKMRNGLKDYISRKYLPEFKKHIGL